MDFVDPEGISIWSMDFDNQKVYGDTSIFDGLVVFAICRRRKKLWAVCLKLRIAQSTSTGWRRLRLVRSQLSAGSPSSLTSVQAVLSSADSDQR